MITVDDVRLLTGIDSTEISDTDIAQIIDKAWEHLISDITVRVVRPLEDYKNTRVFYRISGAEGYVFDTNNDGTIDYDDVSIYYYSNDGTPVTISTPFTYNTQFNELEFSSALDNHTYYIEYREIYTRNQTIIEQAHLWYSAYLLAIRIWGMAPQVVRLGRSGWDMKVPGKPYLDTYRSIVSSILPIGRSIEYDSHPTILDNSI